MSIQDEMEEWRSVEGFPRYLISSLGRCKNEGTGRVLKPGIDDNGYLHYRLCRDNDIPKNVVASHLITQAFTSNPENDHINKIKTFNRINSCNTSGSVGVSFDKYNNKWRASGSFNGKKTFIGRFKTIEEATAARKAWNESHIT